MDPELRARAETRLTEAAARLGLSDPRPPYRDRLKRLRENDPDAFGQAVAHYEARVLPALGEAEPLGVWLEYGAYLGGLTGPGDLTLIDGDGRSAAAGAPVPPGSLVLYLPHDTAQEVLVSVQPQSPTAAQQATLDLLVNRRLTLT
ncbi:MAG TPA: hypothetical protein VK928_07345 [Longimicrobiales bacterium]|nr:hypothetical protein [Longimicrobiales bacterium]